MSERASATRNVYINMATRWFLFVCCCCCCCCFLTGWSVSQVRCGLCLLLEVRNRNWYQTQKLFFSFFRSVSRDDCFQTQPFHWSWAQDLVFVWLVQKCKNTGQHCLAVHAHKQMRRIFDLWSFVSFRSRSNQLCCWTNRTLPICLCVQWSPLC